MKKLLSKISAAVISLIAFCAPSYAIGGTLYINGEVAFKLSKMVRRVSDKSNPNYQLIQDCDKGVYEITDYRTSKCGVKKYILSAFDSNIISCTQYNHYYKAGLKNLLDKRTAVYHFTKRDAAMYKGEMYDSGYEDLCCENLVKTPLQIGRGGKLYERKVCDTRYGWATVFNIEYFSGPRSTMSDEQGKKRYAGYYIKNRRGNVIGKVVGEFFPLDAVLMLYLEGQLKELIPR